VLAVSADPPETMARFAAKYKVWFPLLSDPGFQTIEAYGARRMKQFLGKSFLGIVRSTFLIGPDGVIEKVWPSASARGHAAQVLEALGETAPAAGSAATCE
jgi:peroxiredoxin Q/BCP